MQIVAWHQKDFNALIIFVILVAIDIVPGLIIKAVHVSLWVITDNFNPFFHASSWFSKLGPIFVRAFVIGDHFLVRFAILYAIESHDILNILRIIFNLFIKITFQRKGQLESYLIQAQFIARSENVLLVHFRDQRIVACIQLVKFQNCIHKPHAYENT